MKVKRLLSALLAVAMACSLLCAPAFAAAKDDVLKELNGSDVWVDVDTSALTEEITVKMRGWELNADQSGYQMGEVSQPAKGPVIKLPLGVTFAAGPDNAMIGMFVYTADKDGVYVERLERITATGEDVQSDVLPLDTTGTLKESDTVAYYPWFDWGWGNNRLVGSDDGGYRTLTTDYLVEKFGANTMIVFVSVNDEQFDMDNTIYLLTGEEKPASLTVNSLSQSGIYIADSGDVVSDWAVEPVNTALDAGLVLLPTEEGHNFNLTGYITRAEFAALAVELYRAMTGETPTYGDNPFTDIAEGDTYYQYIIAAYDLKIVTGKTTTTFRPDALVTRQEAAAMLSRVYKAVGGEIPAVTATSFADDGEMAVYARDAIAFMSGKGIINGVGNNRFNPKGNASVEVALKIAVTMLEELG